MKNINFNKKGGKVFKAIASLAFASAMVVAPFTISACSTKSAPPSTETTQPGDQTKPGQDLSNYSQILQTVLTGDYYNDLIDITMKESSAIFFSNPNFSPIPYTFLQQNGHNVAAIKEGQLACKTEMYFIGNNTNNLYISMHVENDSSSITDYVLKYSLTSNEYNDLKMLFEEDYIQAPLFIQELSKQKTANIESKVTLTTKAYEIANEYFTDDFNVNLLSSVDVGFDITYLSVDSKEIKANIRGVSNNEGVSRKTIIVEGTLWDYCFLSENNNIYDFNRISFKSSNDVPGQSINYLGFSKGYTTGNYNNVINK